MRSLTRSTPVLLLPLLLASAPAPGTRAAARAPQGPRAQDVFRPISLEDALARAKVERRLVLADFFRPGDEACRRLEESAWKDPSVLIWIGANTVPVRVDLSARPELAGTQAIESVPTIVLYDYGGPEIGRLTGAVEPKAFLAGIGALYEERGGIAVARRELEKSPQDPRCHVAFARAWRPRRADLTLEHLLWAWDHGEADPSFAEERLLLPREICTLARSSAAAETALKVRREAVYAEVVDPLAAEPGVAPGGAAPDPSRRIGRARDLAALDDALGDAGHLLGAYDALRSQADVPQEVLRILLVERALVLLMQARRYADVARALGDELAALDQTFAEIARLEQAAAEGAATDPAAAQELFRMQNRSVVRAARWHEVMLGLGREREAAEVLDLALLHEGGVQTYVAFCHAALRAGAPAAARALYQRGLGALEKEPDRERLRRVIGANLPAGS